MTLETSGEFRRISANGAALSDVDFAFTGVSIAAAAPVAPPPPPPAVGGAAEGCVAVAETAVGAFAFASTDLV